MKPVCRPSRVLPLLLGLALGLASVVPAARADLDAYTGRPDASFSWKFKGTSATPLGSIHELSLRSQTWQEIPWDHQLAIFQPRDVAPQSTMLLLVTGGKMGLGTQLIGLELARKCQAPVAILFDIPNQPLLGGKKEDALIAETFVRYLNTGDENWPLLFPMVKSVVRAMDVLQAFAKEQMKTPVEQFIVTGGSKRGWTSWLTAATRDRRVKAIAPMVIDVLNMKAQMENQMKSLGKPSAMIHDFTERGLVPLPDTAEARKLWGMVDPYMYRERLTLPKLILLGANDPYWATDALNLYWDGLKGDKWVLYVPNAGHGLEQKNGKGGSDRTRALNTASVFARLQAKGEPLPKLTWTHGDAGERMRLTVDASTAPKGARLWVANAPTRDFREATWVERKADREDGGSGGQRNGCKVVGLVDRPGKGCVAFFAELDYELDGLPYHLSTQMRIAGTPEVTGSGGGAVPGTSSGR